MNENTEFVNKYRIELIKNSSDTGQTLVDQHSNKEKAHLSEDMNSRTERSRRDRKHKQLLLVLGNKAEEKNKTQTTHKYCTSRQTDHKFKDTNDIAEHFQ